MPRLKTLGFSAVDNTATEREESGLGTLRDQLKAWSKANKVKDPQIQPFSARNTTNYGKQLLLVFVSGDGLTRSKEFIHVGKVLSDEFRDGDCLLSSMLDFDIIMHTNKDNDGNIIPDANGDEVTYAMVVRPEIQREDMSSLSAKATDKAAEYVREEAGDLKSILRAQGIEF
jgi:hypothetical protein